MALIQSILKFFGVAKPEPRYKPGDQVQLEGGSELMIVETVTESKDNPPTALLSCKWFDSKSRQQRTEVFSENEVKPFDWYQANS